MRRGPVASALVVVALLFSACGDDDTTGAGGDATTSSTSSTLDEGTTTGTVLPEDQSGEPIEPEDEPGPEVTATGRVTDADGAPVVRAILDLEALDGQPNPAMESLRLTDDDGRYFLAIAPGRWILTIAADGFDLAEVDLDIPADEVLETDVVLTRAE